MTRGVAWRSDDGNGVKKTGVRVVAVEAKNAYNVGDSPAADVAAENMVAGGGIAAGAPPLSRAAGRGGKMT